MQGHIIWVCIGFLAVGVLMPWNTFISSFDYFDTRDLGGNVEFYISCAFNYASVVTGAFAIKYANDWPVTTRIVVSYTVALVVLAFTPMLSLFDLSRDMELWLTLGAVFVTGVCTGVVFGTVLGFASLFPPTYVTAAMSGIGLSGIVAAGLRIITKASLPNTKSGLQESTFIYFGLAGAVLALCVVLYFFMLRHPFVKYHIVAQSSPEVSGEHAGGAGSGATDVVEEVLPAHAPPVVITPETGTDQLGVYEDGIFKAKRKVSVVSVFSKLWKEGLGVYLVFVVTLSMFPGVTSQIKPKNPDFLGNGWYQVMLTSTFMVFDFIGRTSPRFFTLFSPRTLLIPILLRLVFVPIFLLSAGTFSDPYFTSWEGYPFVFMAVFAITNGYCGTLAMGFGPDELDPWEKENGGIQMSFFLNFGVVSGVNIALAFTG